MPYTALRATLRGVPPLLVRSYRIIFCGISPGQRHDHRRPKIPASSARLACSTEIRSETCPALPAVETPSDSAKLIIRSPGRLPRHGAQPDIRSAPPDRKSTRLNSTHTVISYAV